MNKITVIGSVALDSVITPSGKAKEILGGSATFFSIAASFFTKVNLVATVGTDFPDRYRDLITSFGVDIKGLETKNGRTFRWEGSYVENLNSAKTIDTQLNVFSEFKPVIPNDYKKAGTLFLANIDPDLQLFMVKYFGDKSVIGCDSMNHWIQSKCSSLKRLMKKVSFMFLNDAEARLLSGEASIIKAGKALLSLGPKFVIIKRGEYGSVLFSGKDIVCLNAAYPIEDVCDPTGAGDSFAGGFMGYLASSPKITNNTVRKAAFYGSIMASFAVEDFSIKRFLKIRQKDIRKRHARFTKLMS